MLGVPPKNLNASLWAPMAFKALKSVVEKKHISADNTSVPSQRNIVTYSFHRYP